MQIVTDSGVDLNLTPEQIKEFNITILPLSVALDGKSYREGVDITPAEFYALLESTQSFPVTSQPSIHDFTETYRRLAEKDPDILSIHMSSGLSGTFNTSRIAASQVPEARVTHFDTKTLSAGSGWQVEAAARTIKAGWSLEDTLSLVERISNATESFYTLNELKYLIHGGRISHMKGLIASLLNIKPLIGVETVNGTYVQLGKARTFGQSVRKLSELIFKHHSEGDSLRTQVLYAHNPEGGQLLRDLVDEKFDCTWLPMGPMSLVLGAHTGPSMVGVAFAPAEIFEDIPMI